MKKLILLFFAILLVASTQAQTDWSKVDFTKEYNGKTKLNGKAINSLKSNKTFVTSYDINQSIVMKGAQTSSGLQSGNQKSVFAEASLEGVDREAYQKMSNELYKELLDGLLGTDLIITDGEDVLDTKSAQKRMGKNDKKIIIGNSGENPSHERKKDLTTNSIIGYAPGAGATLRDISFPPSNKNSYLITKTVYGNFYNDIVLKEKYNLMFVNYYVSFAAFDGGNGYKKAVLETKPVIAVKVNLGLMTVGGKVEWSYEKEIWAGDDWVKEMGKVKDNQGTAEFWGLARSADYAVVADSDKYLAEVGSIISNLQKDMVKNLKTELQ